MQQIYQQLADRGFIYQVTHEEELRHRLSQEPQTFYIGFDPTADSLHVGSLIPIIVMVHMQRAGHRPIAVLGGGTALVGDPSGKTEMRQMMTRETIDRNGIGIKEQLERFLDLEPDHGWLINNADWLEGLRYIDFLRDIGRHFSVNRMLTAESYRQRLETGLSFIEFNYMLLQAYDFHVLHRDYQCTIQMGGQDQWGNIVAGVDLIRRVQSQEAFGITFPLLTTASGEKFGKTAAGAVWLDEQRTSVYDFYQFWRNSEDGELGRLLRLFTFLPLDEISRLEQLRDQGINRAKEILAFEVTTLVHGQEKAAEAYRTATGQFGAADPDRQIETSSAITTIETTTLGDNLPETIISPAELEQGITIVDLFIKTGLCSSKGQARRLIQQGGGYCNDNRITEDFTIDNEQLIDSQLILRAGKKRHHRIVIQT
ncbi:MAG: tyrosine--tRNA ligase [Deltaproteobacteria bacterium]|nr:tyrosine--tRNA ligase [Candidatus Anaeroferrophillus wilburensis]MBN2888432.1 tyrosine--tRNA ligase [Deltaproteobacteria bacterium]